MRHHSGWHKDEVLFPDLHDEDFVVELKGLPKVDAAVAERQSQRADARGTDRLHPGTDGKRSRKQSSTEWSREFGQFDKRVRDNIEGGLQPVISRCAWSCSNCSGAPSMSRKRSRRSTNTSEGDRRVRVPPGRGRQGTGPRQHARTQGTQRRAEEGREFHEGSQAEWREEVVASGKPGLLGHEHPGKPQQPARPKRAHLRIRGRHRRHFNPNLAKFKQADWDFVSDMAGERAISTRSPGALTRRVRKRSGLLPGAPRTQMLDATKKLRSQSAELATTFASDTSLRARLRLIVSASPQARDKKAGRKSMRCSISHARDQGKRQGSSGGREKAPDDVGGGDLQTAADRVGAGRTPPLSCGTSSSSRSHRTCVSWQSDGIGGHDPCADCRARRQSHGRGEKTQHRCPVHQEHRQGIERGRGRGSHRAGAPGVARPASAVDSQGDRSRGPCVGRTAQAWLRSVRPDDRQRGTKVGPGAGMGNIAARGFSNLNEKLVVALVQPEGGNLSRLGVQTRTCTISSCAPSRRSRRRPYRRPCHSPHLRHRRRQSRRSHRA